MCAGVGGLRDCFLRWQKVASVFLPAILLLTAVSCGAPGVPLPPSLHLPQPVSDLHALRKGDKVHLTWTAPTRTTDRQLIRQAGVIQICRSVEATLSACGTPAGEVPALQRNPQQKDSKISQEFVDHLPGALLTSDPAGEIVYAVSALNSEGRSAGLSNEVKIPAISTLPPPQDMHAIATAEGIEVTGTSANAPATASGVRYFYRIYRREKGSDNAAGAIAGEATWKDSLRFVDHAFSWEKTYLYRVTVVTGVTRGQATEIQVEGDDSREVEVFAHDVFPPAVPSGLQAVYSAVSGQPFVDLVWSPDVDIDLDGYNVYRMEDGGESVKINPQLVKTPAFRDANVKAGKTYSYSVSAVDVRGNESARSEAASESVP